MESQSKTKLKLVAQLPVHLLERISWKDWPIIAKESVNDNLVVILNVSHMTICRLILKMNISCFKREKTPKYTEKQAQKAKNLSKNLLTYYIDRNAAWFWTMKNTLLLMAQTWRETTTTTRMTSQIVQIVFVSLKKRSFRQKLWSGWPYANVAYPSH